MVFTDIQKMKEFTTTRLALQEMLKAALLPETQKYIQLSGSWQKQKTATLFQNSVLNIYIIQVKGNKASKTTIATAIW